MNAEEISKWIDQAYAIGMFQHRAEIEPFAQWIAEQKPRNVLEIGSWAGGSAYLWGKLASGKVISIDLPMGEFGGKDCNLTIERCRARNEMLLEHNPNFIGILGDSHDLAIVMEIKKIVGEEGIDLLFIDGDHTYEGVDKDISYYLQFMNWNSVIALHDINDTELHRSRGVEVARRWQVLQAWGGPHAREWTIGGDWGGIGALRLGKEIAR